MIMILTPSFLAADRDDNNICEINVGAVKLKYEQSKIEYRFEMDRCIAVRFPGFIISLPVNVHL